MTAATVSSRHRDLTGSRMVSPPPLRYKAALVSLLKLGFGGMRYLLPLLAVVLVGCSQSEASRIGDRTYRIVSPEVPGGAEGPNRRLADQLCPNGYRKIDEQNHKGGPDRATYSQDITTIWTIKCI